MRVDPSHLAPDPVEPVRERVPLLGRRFRRTRVEIRIGRLAGSNRPFLEVLDRGPGIDSTISDRIFEPVLHLARERHAASAFSSRARLAQCNRALLVYEPRTGGGSVFRIVFADPQRWEQT